MTKEQIEMVERRLRSIGRAEMMCVSGINFVKEHPSICDRSDDDEAYAYAVEAAHDARFLLNYVPVV